MLRPDVRGREWICCYSIIVLHQLFKSDLMMDFYYPLFIMLLLVLHCDANTVVMRLSEWQASCLTLLLTFLACPPA